MSSSYEVRPAFLPFLVPNKKVVIDGTPGTVSWYSKERNLSRISGHKILKQMIYERKAQSVERVVVDRKAKIVRVEDLYFSPIIRSVKAYDHDLLHQVAVELRKKWGARQRISTPLNKRKI